MASWLNWFRNAPAPMAPASRYADDTMKRMKYGMQAGKRRKMNPSLQIQKI
jgi:hypothetical protein